MTLQSFLKSRFATWVLLPVFILALLGFGRVYFQKRAIDIEIAKLVAQADKIEKDNQQLGSLIKYFATPQYQEKQAREKLNLKKDGEYVVALPELDTAESTEKTLQPTKTENLKSWLNYFFHAN